MPRLLTPAAPVPYWNWRQWEVGLWCPWNPLLAPGPLGQAIQLLGQGVLAVLCMECSSVSLLNLRWAVEAHGRRLPRPVRTSGS